MDNKELIEILKADLVIQLPEEASMDRLRGLLAVYINDLIEKNFQQLVNILYRLDVSEEKLKQMLQSKYEDAGLIITDLIIERQNQKLESRKRFQQQQKDIDEAEKW
jgi:hypothetical protein